MLQPLLSPKECAACRICCVFDRTDLWEFPFLSAETAETMRAFSPELPVQEAVGGFVYTPTARDWDDEGLCVCPALGEHGCRLSAAQKPFACRVWPFRVMQKDGETVIAVAELCKPVSSRKKEELIAFLQQGLAAELFAYAAAIPASVPDYHDGYTVLLRQDGSAV